MYLTDSKHIILERNGKRLRFRKSLFWDLPEDRVDSEKNMRLIMERVFTRGNLNEFKELRAAYSVEVIKENIIRIGSMDKKTLSFLSKSYQIPLINFKCYTKNQ